MKAKEFLRRERKKRTFYFLNLWRTLLFQGELKIKAPKGEQKFETLRDKHHAYHLGESFMIK